MKSYLLCDGMWCLGYRMLQGFSASLDLEMKGENGDWRLVESFLFLSVKLLVDQLCL